MKTSYSTVYDYIILSGTHKEEDKPALNDAEGKTVYPLKRLVSGVYFYQPIWDERGDVTFKKILLDRDEIFALADKIKELESTPVPDGLPDHEDDDLPF